MKRKSSARGGGGGDDEKWEEGTNKNRSSSSSSNDGNNKKKKNKTNLPPPPKRPSVIGTVATRTRRQQKELATKWNQPIAILIHIMGYADPETIRMLCCVSKQFRDLIANDPGMEQNRAIPLLQITPADDKEDEGRVGRLLQFLQHHRDKLQRYRAIKIIDPNKFELYDGCFQELDKITDALRLYGIVSLDMPSLSSCRDMGNYNYLCHFFPLILPNLRDVNLSNTSSSGSSTPLSYFSQNCFNLEKITWHNIDRDQSVIDINGLYLRHAANLKEIYMDDSNFLFRGNECDKLLDLENDAHSNIFLFYRCSTKLERVSIRNAKWYVNAYVIGVRDDMTVIPQNALIKFVRKAPTSLLWFRSDLTEENMMMLRSERPGIELVN